MFGNWFKSDIERLKEFADQFLYERMKAIVHDAVYDVDTIVAMKKKLAEVEVEYAKKREEWDRREREVEHKIGLERKRQEFEIEQSKRETTVAVREDNLKADKERFKSEMDFQRQHLEGEVTSLRDLVAQMMERLPSAEIFADLGRTGSRSKED